MLRKKLKLNSQNHPIDYSRDSSSNHEEFAQNSCDLPPTQYNITSIFFRNKTFWQKFYEIELKMNILLRKNITLSSLQASAVVAVYNPIEYASALHCEFLARFLSEEPPVEILFLGMNPGPWGMCQTGVPFGHAAVVRDWMKLDGAVLKPEIELPERPISGLSCTRTEQSGKRFWGLFQEVCGSPENFFKHSFVQNYCPLAFFERSGKNVTPADLKGIGKTNVEIVCSEFMLEIIQFLKPKFIVSIGRYTYDRINTLLKNSTLDPNLKNLFLLHPSPLSRQSHNWCADTKTWLIEQNLMKYFQQ